MVLAVNGLDHFEALAEQLIEGTFERLFRPRLHPSQVARYLARAMEDGQVFGDAGQLLLPNQYWVFLNPDDFVALDAGDETLRTELLRYMERLAAGMNARFSGPLRVALDPIPDLESGQLDVRAAHVVDSRSLDDTRGIEAFNQSAADAKRWYLEIGERVVSLGEPVVRLGRALSNDIILEDQRISRRHAQLRWRAGSYHLSDIGSRGGTFLNGHLLRQGEEFPLAAGDRIDLAGITLTIQVAARQPSVDGVPTPPLPAQDQ
ncbi:MAG: DUF3662 and FHA domain-containing protein [Anaerolineae bacterium]